MLGVEITPEQVRAVWLDPNLTRLVAAAHLGVEVHRLQYLAKKLDLEMRGSVAWRAGMTQLSDERVREVWGMTELSRKEQARVAGVALTALTDHAQRLKLPMRRTAKDKRVSAARVREVWLDPRMTGQQAADAVGLTRVNLWHRAKKLGLPPRTNLGRFSIPDGEPERLFKEMWEARVRTAHMGEHFGIHTATVGDHARRLKLTKRTRPTELIGLDEFWRVRREARLSDEMKRVAAADNAAMARFEVEDGMAQRCRSAKRGTIGPEASEWATPLPHVVRGHRRQGSAHAQRATS